MVLLKFGHDGQGDVSEGRSSAKRKLAFRFAIHSFNRAARRYLLDAVEQDWSVVKKMKFSGGHRRKMMQARLPLVSMVALAFEL